MMATAENHWHGSGPTTPVSQSRSLWLLGWLALTAVANPAHAVDGVVLIDQNRALAGNVTPGDAPGFPVTLTLSGSYRLSGNLTVPDANTSAIVVAADVTGVTVDLNGFTISGPTVCGGFPIVCSPLGSGIGVSAPNGARAITVRNGTIVGMGTSAVQLLSSLNTVDNISAISNGQVGIFASLATVTNNRALKNGFNGLLVGNSVVMHNLAVQNGGAGIGGNDNLIVNNTLTVNALVGVAAANSAFSGNQFSSNNGGAANPQFSGRGPIGPNGCDGSVCP